MVYRFPCWGRWLSLVWSFFILFGNMKTLLARPPTPGWTIVGIFSAFIYVLYPLYAALIAFLISNIEHKNKGFKHIFTLAAPKLYFYFSKLAILLFWMLSSLVFGAILLFAGAQLIANTLSGIRVSIPQYSRGYNKFSRSAISYLPQYTDHSLLSESLLEQFYCIGRLCLFPGRFWE